MSTAGIMHSASSVTSETAAIYLADDMTIPEKMSGLLLKTTPRMLAFLDARIPDHKYRECFPAALLEEHLLGATELEDLLWGTSVYFPPKPIKEVDEKYAESMRILREKLEEADYQKMVDGPPISSLADSRNDLRELRNQLSTIVNVMLSIFSAAMASWYWTSQWTTPGRVLASLGSAIGLGAIETFLYFRYRVKIQQGIQYDARMEMQSKVGDKVKIRRQRRHNRTH